MAGGIILLVIAVGVGVAFATGGLGGNDTIGKDAAVEIALKDAGIDAKDATVKRTELDYEGGIQIYDVGFYAGNMEYDYDISATDGKILQRDFEEEFYSSNNSNLPESNPVDTSTGGAVTDNQSVADGAANNQTADANTEYIGVDKAKSIAIEHAGIGADKVSFSKAKLENDDGKYGYEVEFYGNGREYDYDIDAKTGEVLAFSNENID